MRGSVAKRTTLDWEKLPSSGGRSTYRARFTVPAGDRSGLTGITFHVFGVKGELFRAFVSVSDKSGRLASLRVGEAKTLAGAKALCRKRVGLK